MALRRERVDAPDGDLWLFDWLDSDRPNDSPLVVLFHGLEGSSTSNYARALMHAVGAIGWRGVVPHFRGCGGETNRLPRAYHSGDHAEIGAMLAAIRARVPPETTVFAVGVSLGGSALLNWLGRVQGDASRVVAAAATASTPLDLAAAGFSIDVGLNKIYSYHFLRTLKPKSVAMSRRFPGLIDAKRVRATRTMRAFDDVVTAPLHGFADAMDYWTRGSSKPWLKSIALPTLVINAENDPFIPARSLASANDASRDVIIERPSHGGHGAFPQGPFPGNVDWLPQRVLHFFRSGV
jgi:predicted alpha/beta-fold hydrolase